MNQNKTQNLTLKSVVWKEGDYYISQCLEVDVSSYGKTKDEAVAMLQDALELYFQDIPFPEKTEIVDPFITSVPLHNAKTLSS